MGSCKLGWGRNGICIFLLAFPSILNVGNKNIIGVLAVLVILTGRENIFVSQSLLLFSKYRLCWLLLPWVLRFDALTQKHSPGWCGLVGWALSCKPKSLRFDAWSGHMPRWRARSWSGHVQEATDQCFSLESMFLSFSFSPALPVSLKSISMSLGEDKQ